MKKILPMPTKCPVSDSELIVTSLECLDSGVKIKGRFRPNEFSYLTGNELEFMRLFLKTRGNLKEVERILEVSYPTVRLRFEKLLQELGYEAYEAVEDVKTERLNVLELLQKGEITASEATKRLKGLK